MVRITTIVLALLSMTTTGANAATKVDEGFTTGISRDGRSLKRVARASTDDPVYYFIALGDHKGGPASSRCVVKGGPKGETLVDDTDTWDDQETDVLLFCGMDGDEKELDEGNYTFTLYLNGEQVGERSIGVDKKPFFKLNVFEKFKWALGALAAVILAIYWVRKKLYGDKTIDAAFPPKEAAAVANARASVVIGSNIAGGAMAPREPAKPAEPTPDDLLKKFKAILAIDPAAKPMRPEDVLPIVKAARAAGDSKTAVAAVRGFDKANPGHALIPDVYIVSAKIMAEDLKNFGMARKVLEHLIGKYPGHYLAQEARRDLKDLPS